MVAVGIGGEQKLDLGASDGRDHRANPKDSKDEFTGMTEEQRKKEEKRRERLAKIAKWKAEKEKQKESASPQPQPQPQPSTPAAVASAPKTHKGFASSAIKIQGKQSRALFMGDDENDNGNSSSSRQMKKPRLMSLADHGPAKEPLSKVDETDDDPLDHYMETLASTEVSGQPLPELMVLSDSEEELDGENSHEISPEEALALLEKSKKSKDISPVDHSKMDYEPFRKNFYVEPQEITEMTDVEVENARLELDAIKVRGHNCPRPVTKWAQFGLSAVVLQIIVEELGYEKPSAIQAQGIPALMSGRDVIGVAKTGSGKTMSFLLPMFRQIKDQRPLSNMDGPIGLIMTPTRELAVQIFRECKPFLKALDLRAVCAYGGSPIKEQIAELKRGAEIVVCTPGRMIDLLTANQGRVTNLSRVTYLVLDEADRMFDMGFEPQVMKIIKNIRPDRQTALFSATFPRQMEALARKILSKPIEIVVGARSVVAPEITQIVEVLPDTAAKFHRTLQLLGQQAEGAGTLLFVERQESADQLFRELIARGYPSLVIHGGKDQADRDSAISDFKKGLVSLLVATSVAARGLDVKHLRLVINYDTPSHLEDYVHRVGRTGRAGNKGTAVTFLLPDQTRAAVDISKALKLSKVDVPEQVKEMADKFMEQVKEGKEQYTRRGFKGKGLDKLEAERKQQRALERKAYGEETGGEAQTVETDEPTPETASAGPDMGGIIKQAVIIQGAERSTKVKAGAAPDNKGPDVGAYHAKLEINDFPQKARWQASSRTNQAKVIETHGVSLTLKGIYYPPGKGPANDKEEPKLYLLIEGSNESSVLGAYQQLQSLMVSGIEQTAQSKGTRYTV